MGVQQPPLIVPEAIGWKHGFSSEESLKRMKFFVELGFMTHEKDGGRFALGRRILANIFY